MNTHDFNSNKMKKAIEQMAKEDAGLHSQADYENVRQLAEPHLAAILEELSPDGELKGNEYLMLNPHRPEDCNRGSFKFNVDTGRWSDFAANDAKGGDIISLVAYLKKLRQADAAAWISGFVEQAAKNEKTMPPRIARYPSRMKTKKEDEGVAMLPIPADAPAPPTMHPKLGTPSRTYEYKDASGRLLSLICRFEATAASGKEFRPLTYRRFQNGSRKWVWKSLEHDRPLYNLEELAARPSAAVILVEGEKSAEAAKKLFPKSVAVSTMGGSKAAGKADFGPLRGRPVLIWPDNDEPGRDFAKDVVRLLLEQDEKAAVSVMPVPNVQPAPQSDGVKFLDGFVAPEGWDAADALADGWTAEHIGLFIAANRPSPVEARPKVPGYLIDDRGVHAVKYKDGDEQLVFVCSRIEVVAQSFNPAGAEWGLLLSIRNPDGNSVEWCMPRSMMANKSGLQAELLKRGASLQSPDAVVAYFLTADPKARAIAVRQPGWHKDAENKTAFVLPHQTISEEGTARMVIEAVDPKKRFASRGDLAEWNRLVGAPCSGNTRLVFSVCVALTGPALHILDEENGGFHMYGQSSIGKSTATQVAASVWGCGEFVRSWKTTDNALEATASLHNDTLLVLDEANQASAEVLADVTYMLGNGEGKSRADRSGAAKATHDFRLVYLSNGEESLKLRLQSDDIDMLAGQEVRLPSFAADAQKGMGLFEELHGHVSPQDFARHFKTSVASVHGTLGPAWVRKLLEERASAEFSSRVKHAMQDFVSSFVPVGASSQVLRVAQRFALVAAVGEEAVRAGLLPWAPGEATKGSKACFLSWIEERGGVESQERQRYLSQVRRLIGRYAESRFSLWEQPEGCNDVETQVRTFDRMGWRRLDADDVFDYYVLPEAYNTVLCGGLDPRMMTRFLRELNLLALGPGDKSQITKRVPGHAAQKFYCIKGAILAGGDD